jgi:uncharacterized integral membrane protein (TIGR00698 family)
MIFLNSSQKGKIMLLSPQWTLLAGMLLSLVLPTTSPLHAKAKTWSARLLQVSVILLGSALDFNHVMKQGAESVLVTFISISAVFLLGFIGMKLLRLERTQGILITMGTAICGGSAIGALAPVLAADSLAVTISIGTVFLLNAVSVFIFPGIGHAMSLSQEQFGLWSALAIHDTSAVVASASLYGKEALSVASTVKLTRALWIIPITVCFSIVLAKKDKKITIPWFIFGFLGLSLLFTFFEPLAGLKPTFLYLSKQGFAITLFLIGLTFSISKIRSVGAKPFVFGIGLWLIVCVTSLIYVRNFTGP